MDGFDAVEVSGDVFAQVDAAQPIKVQTVVAGIVNKLPEDERPEANSALMGAIQEFLSDCRSGLEAASTRELARIRQFLVEHARQQSEAKLAELVKQAGPMNPDEMQKLVSQEYLRFPIMVEYFDSTDSVDYSEKQFVIREVPQSVEKRIVDTVLQQIIPALQKFQGLKFTAGTTPAQKLEQAVKAIPEIFDMLCDITAICLNPYNKDPMVTKDWVQQNLSSSRMFGIVQAQFMANRIRDFFSGVYRSSLGM